MSPPPARRKRFSWRRWNNILHRDFGYLAVGLTLIYAISGIAVNHIDDWNPNYDYNAQDEHFEPFAVTDKATMVATLVTVLALPGPPMESFRSAPHQVQLFYDGWNVEADVLEGMVANKVGRHTAMEYTHLPLAGARQHAPIRLSIYSR